MSSGDNVFPTPRCLPDLGLLPSRPYYVLIVCGGWAMYLEWTSKGYLNSFFLVRCQTACVHVSGVKDDFKCFGICNAMCYNVASDKDRWRNELSRGKTFSEEQLACQAERRCLRHHAAARCGVPHCLT